MSSRVTIRDPAQFIALLESGADVYGLGDTPLTSGGVLWAWYNDSRWRYKCLSFWLPNGSYSVEVE